MNKINHFRSSAGSATSAIVTVVACLSLTYLLSSPFRVKMDRIYEQATSWTPAQIQKDTAGYLTWATTECQSIQDRIGAKRIEIGSARDRLANQIEKLRDEIPDNTELLEKTKIVIRSGIWPAYYQGRQISKIEAEQLLLLLADRSDLLKKQSTAIHKQLAAAERGLSLLSARNFEVDRVLLRIQSLQFDQSFGDVEIDGSLASSLESISNTLAGVTVSTQDMVTALHRDDVNLSIEAQIEEILQESTPE